MTFIGKILLGSVIGVGALLVLTTPQERLRLLGISPASPKDVAPKRTLPPAPVPQKPDSLIFAALPVGSVIALKEDEYLTHRDSVPSNTVIRVPNGSQLVIEERFPPERDYGPLTPWAYIGRNDKIRLPITEREILRVLSRPRLL